MEKINIVLIIAVFIICYYLFILFKNKDGSFKNKKMNSIEVFNKTGIKYIDIYGNFLFEILGICYLLKAVFVDFVKNKKKDFSHFIKDYNHYFTYENGDNFSIKKTNDESLNHSFFSIEIKQILINKIKQSYMIVRLPLNNQYHIEYYRVIKILDDLIYNLDRNNKKEHIIDLKKDFSFLSFQNKSFLTNLINTNQKSVFFNGLGFCYYFQHLINEFGFENSIYFIKKYHYLFKTKYGEDLWIEKKIKGENDWIHYFDSLLDKSRMGVRDSISSKKIKEMCKKDGLECDYIKIMIDIQNVANKGGGISTFNWFNNILRTAILKKGIIFKEGPYVYGSGYQLLEEK